jgi:hypothetical protein
LAFLVVVVLFNTVLARKLPLAEGLVVILHVLGVVVFIPLLILKPRSEGGGPIVEFDNPSGWMSTAVATLVGSGAPLAGLIGVDCSVHMGMFEPLTFWPLFLTHLPYS